MSGSEAAPEPAVGSVPAVESGRAAETGPVPASEGAPASAAAPVPEAVSVPESGPQAAAVGRPRRRGRTAVLIASAAVLGVLAGGGLGYRVQYQRTPTPLPPLTVPALAQPTGPAPLAPSLAAVDDRAVAVYDADLLSLLLSAPKGASEVERRWVPLLEYADEFHDPDDAFREYAESGYRRGVSLDWMQAGDTYSRIDLTQFRDEKVAHGPDRCHDETFAADSDPYSGYSVALKSAVDATAWPSAASFEIPGTGTRYEGRGVACVGSIVVTVIVVSPHPVEVSTVARLVNEQVGRL